MKISRNLKMTLHGLKEHPMRTFLMMLGIIIGVVALTVIVSIGQRSRQQVVESFKRMVVVLDNIVIRPGGSASRGMPTMTEVDPTLKLEDARAIATEVSAIKRVAPVQNTFGVDIKFEKMNTRSSVFGITEEWFEIRNEQVARGSILTKEDVDRLARVCIIGKTIASNFFGERNPVGESIRITNVNFQVKGVLQERGASPGGGDMDNIVFVPLTTFSRRLFNMDHLTMAIAQLDNPDNLDKAKEQITALLRERHNIAAGALDDFRLSSPRESMQRMASIRGSFDTYLALIASISLVVGGLLVMNIMLVSVSERRKEIGIRRSVGARKRDIFFQFLIEAAVVTFLGGLIGVTLSVVGSFGFFILAEMPFYFSWQALGLSLLAATVVGLVSGIQPARRAAAMDPIEPLRE